MSAWWKRNRIALAAIVVLLPATIGLTFSAQWEGYFASFPSKPTVVAVHQSATYGDTEWQVTDSQRYTSDSAIGSASNLPTGTDLIVVTFTVNPVRVDNDGLSAYCTIDLDELSGDSIVRTWHDATLQPIDYEAGDQVGCSSENQRSYSSEIYFVVPSDAGTGDHDLALNLSVADELPHYLRLYF